MVQEAAHPDAHIIFGASVDDTLDDEIRITVVATGFDETPQKEPKNIVRDANKHPGQQSAPITLTDGTAETAKPESSKPEGQKPREEGDDPFEAILRIFKDR